MASDRIDSLVARLKSRGKYVGQNSEDGYFAHDELSWDAANAIINLQMELDWFKKLFDFSDPEIVVHAAPNHPVTADAVVMPRDHYEAIVAKKN